MFFGCILETLEIRASPFSILAMISHLGLYGTHLYKHEQQQPFKLTHGARHLHKDIACFHTDVFFVLTAYVASAAAFSAPPSSAVGGHRVRIAAAGVATGVLRRIIRTVPMVLVSGCMSQRGTVLELFAAMRPGVFVGAHWPGRWPNTWPFGVEMICLAILRIILALIFVAGDRVSW